MPTSLSQVQEMATEDDDWEPLSEADKKLLEARRERQDQISKRMGDYLLKGYKMLATTCPRCDTILLQTRQGQNYCVTCSELDSDADKDNPVLSQTAAMSMAREMERSSTETATSTIKTERTSAASSPSPRHQPPPITSSVLEAQRQRPALTARSDPDYLGMTSIDVQCWPTDPRDVQTRKSDSAASARQGRVDFGGDGDSGVCLSTSGHVTGSQGKITIGALTDKVKWATQELSAAVSVEYSMQLCQLIKVAAEACVSIRGARI